MKEFTFLVVAACTVHAETEEEARVTLVRSCREEDTPIGDMGVYLPVGNAEVGELVDIWGEDE